MTIDTVARLLDGQVIFKGEAADRRVAHVVVSDLMSDVLLVDQDDILLITSLASDQVLRTAQIVGAVGVVVANGKPLPSTMIGVAEGLRMSLVTTPHAKYECCIEIYEQMKKEAADAG